MLRTRVRGAITHLLEREHDERIFKEAQLDALRARGGGEAHAAECEVAHEARDLRAQARRLVDAVDDECEAAHLERHREHHQPVALVVLVGKVLQHLHLGERAACLERIRELAREALHVEQRGHRLRAR